MEEPDSPSRDSLCWYVGYGSNLRRERLGGYLADFKGAGLWRSRSVIIPMVHRRYFAGTSRTWSGPVAFIETDPQDTIQHFARAYLMDFEELREVVRRENGVSSLALTPEALPSEAGESLRLEVELDDQGSRGKYNLLLRLPDFDDGSGPRPTYAVTTTYDLPLGSPTKDYRLIIEEFEANIPGEVRKFLAASSLLMVEGGVEGDIPVTDTVRVSEKLFQRLGCWAQLTVVKSGLVAPVRLEVPSADEGVPRRDLSGKVEIAYALRTFLDLQRGDLVSLTPLESASAGRGESARYRLEKLVEPLLNAPPIPLRAVEGLVGDDALPVVRVDPTALEYVGLDPGDVGFLSWGRRSVQVRVLLQTATTAERMEMQLSETTGHQVRPLSNLVEQRGRAPRHLRVWVSSTVRQELGIDRDTVVRLRRSVIGVIGKHLLRLAVPLVVFLFGFLMEQPPSYWWLGGLLALLTVIAAFYPLRMPSPRRRRPRWRRRP